MADETIVTRYIVEGDEALEDSEKLRQITEEVKKELAAARDEGKSMFSDIATAMKLAVQAGAEYRKEIEAIKEDFQEFKKTTIDPTAIAAAQERMKEQIAEVRKEWRMTVEATKIAINEITTAEKQSVKIIQQIERQKDKTRRDAMREYVRITRQGYGVMSQAAKTYGMEIDKIKQKIVAMAKAQGVSFNEAAQSLKGFNVQDINVALRELDGQTKETSEGFRLFGREIRGVGDIAGLVFGTILGVSAIQVLQNIVQWLTQSTQGAIEFAQSIFRLEVSTRALRRAGIDVTFKSAAKQAEELGKKFGVFTQKELIGGISNIQLLTRNFNFTEEQMKQVAEASATLAVLLGDDLNEAARKMALFMSSGYAESMQRAGLAVNRRVVEEKAHALGIRKSYLELTEQERAFAALQVVLEQVNPLTEDAVKFQESLAGQVRETTAELQTQQDVLGTKLLPLKVAWTKIIVELVEAYSWLVLQIERVGISLRTYIMGPVNAIVDLYKAWEEGTLRLANVSNIVADAINRTKEELMELAQFVGKEDILEGLRVFDDELPLGDISNVEEQAEQVKQIVMDMIDEIDKAMEDLKSRQDALARDLARDMERMSRDNTRNIQDIWSKFFRRMEDIQTRYQQRIADAQSKYERQVEDEQRKFALRREQIQEKQRERLLKIERDYQERLRRLREDFLFSLEDAIRERDAREVLQLVRRFKLEKDRAKRERDNRMKELKEQGTAEMRELARQQAERMAQLKRELDERIRSIALARAREREDAKLARERALADEAEEYRIRKKEREIRHKEQMDEAEARYNERLEKLAEALSEEYDITEEMAGKIRDLLMREYGPGGTAEQIYNYLIGIIQNAAAAISESIARISQAYRSIPTVKYTGAPGLEGTTTPTVKYTGDTYQEGGTLVATKPTIAMFGEVPEVVTFTPINRIGTNEGKVFGGTLPASARRDGKIRLEILLSPGLEAEIVDNSLGQLADIIERVLPE